MPAGRQFDPELLAEACAKYRTAKGRKERGEVVEKLARTVGVSRATAQRRLKKALEDQSVITDVSAGKSRTIRKSQATLKKEKQDALTIASIKMQTGDKSKYYMSTERALEIAENSGLIEEGRYTRSTMDRILKSYGLNKKSYATPQGVYRLTADYSNQVIMVDATPANHYYLRLDGELVKSDFPSGDTHTDDILRRDGLYKIWVYYAVDLFSKAFLVRAFAPIAIGEGSRNGGENSEDWREFLTWMFLNKSGLEPLINGKPHPLRNSPFEGVPDILFSDRGSGLTAKITQNFLLRLGSRPETHLPGMPNAKGAVEARIGGFKRSYESALLKGTVKTLDEVNHYYASWCNYHNKINGHYEKYLEGLRLKPLRRVTEQNIRDAYVSHVTRTIDGYGCVSIDGEEWFVDENHVGQKVQIYSAPAWRGSDERWIAQLPSGLVLTCKPGAREHSFTEIKTFVQTNEQINRDEVRVLSRQIAKVITFEDTLPPEDEEKILHFPPRTEAVETVSPIPPDQFESIEDARRWITFRTGLSDSLMDEDTLEAMDKGFETFLDKTGSIPGDIVQQFANILLEDTENSIGEEKC